MAQTEVELQMEKVVFTASDLIMRALFGLTKKQAECFKKINAITKPGICISSIGERMGDVDRSVVQKQVKVLFDKKLILRKQVTLAEFRDICKQRDSPYAAKTDRGYLYLYEPLTKAELLEKATEKMGSWSEILQREILN